MSKISKKFLLVSENWEQNTRDKPHKNIPIKKNHKQEHNIHSKRGLAHFAPCRPISMSRQVFTHAPVGAANILRPAFITEGDHGWLSSIKADYLS